MLGANFPPSSRLPETTADRQGTFHQLPDPGLKPWAVLYSRFAAKSDTPQKGRRLRRRSLATLPPITNHPSLPLPYLLFLLFAFLIQTAQLGGQLFLKLFDLVEFPFGLFLSDLVL